jgi:hypothetical protein
VFIKYAGEKLEYNFSKVDDKNVNKELPTKDEVVNIAYVSNNILTII